MIVKMSKITLLVDEANAKKALKDLRKLGVLHVKPIPNPPSVDMSEIETRLEETRRVLSLLGEADEAKQKGAGNAGKIVDEILEKMHQRSGLEREKEALQDDLRWYDEWSHVSLQDIRDLEDKGYHIKVYQLSPSAWKEIQEKENLFALTETKDKVNVALISRDPDETLDHRPVSIPETPYKQAVSRMKQIDKELGVISKDIEKHHRHIELIRAYAQSLESDHQFAAVQNGLGMQENIAYLQGYVPAEEASTVEKAAEKKGWGYVEEAPTVEDNPPTKLKNAKWIKIIEPVFDFLGTVPGYHEKDISMYFLIFFAVFVAMIIGDAGYGMIFLLISIFATIKIKRGGDKLPGAIILLYVLSSTTIAWGAITGTWFGTIPEGSFLNALVIDKIATQNSVQMICFILAVVQLGLANIMNFIENLPKLKAFEHIGWLGIMIGAFALVLNLVLNITVPASVIIPLIGGGFAFIILFSAQEPGKSFFKGVLGGLGGAFNTFLDAISSFSNIISYIRLFAVGMASVAIADSFNNMASGMMHGPLIIGGIIVLLIGHGLNIVMGLLSVMVHGIRLNLLEFSGQLGLEWTGYKYKPFKDK